MLPCIYMVWSSSDMGNCTNTKKKSSPSLSTATHHSCYTNATSACGQGLGDAPAQRESALWNVLLYRVSSGCVSLFCGQPFLFKFVDGVPILISHTFLGSLKSSFHPKIFSSGNCTRLVWFWDYSPFKTTLKRKKTDKKSRPSMRSNYSPFNTFSTHKNSAEEKLCWGWLPAPPALHGILPQSPLALSMHGLFGVERSKFLVSFKCIKKQLGPEGSWNLKQRCISNKKILCDVVGGTW